MEAEYIIPIKGSDGKTVQMEIKQKNFHGKRRKVKTWTAEQDTQLLRLYDQNPKKWSTIASLMNDRNQNQCLHRYRRLSQLGANRKIWSSEQDQTIKRLIKKVGKNWKLLSEALGSKTGKQIRERFINKLDPKIKKQEWSDQEDRKLIQLYSQLGSKWSQISKRLPGRPQNKIKNRFYSFIQKNYDIKYKLIQQGNPHNNSKNTFKNTTSKNNTSQIKQKLKNNTNRRGSQLNQITYQFSNNQQKEPIHQQCENEYVRIENELNNNFHNFQNYQNFNCQYHMQPFSNWQYQNIQNNNMFNNNFLSNNINSNKSNKKQISSFNDIKLEIQDEPLQNLMNDNKQNSLFQSKVYLKSLLKIEDDWGFNNITNNNYRFRSINDINDITSQHELGHQNDLLYLSHH